MTRQRNARGEGARLRDELLDAAARLVEAAGSADAVTLRAVAREAGIAAPSIYRHFTDWDDLLRALVAHRFERLDDELARAMSAAADPEAALRACCAAYCRFGLDNPGHYRVLFGTTLSFATAPEVPGLQVFQRLVAAVEQAGVARPELAAIDIWLALHGIVSLRTSRPTFPWPPLTDLIEAALRRA
ncbi:TetR/AcrR family transcriptional regulator [Nocardia sp. NPDC050712]|uniref:TetR/AcrR family transcriptional regulator n=1 Tax=Nocardia sp. NPDC050712 TaxID=3155518 RepID=UPI0033D0C40D